MTKELHERFRISRLITKRLMGGATEEENRQLDEWLEASPAHRHTYEEWVNRLQHDIDREEPADANEAWRRFAKRMPAARPRLLRPRYLYAYAACLIGILLWVGISFHSQSPEIETVIVPGTPKAQLITEAGEDIEVKPMLQLQLSQSALQQEVHNEDGILHYDRITLPVDSFALTHHTLNVPKGGEYQIVLSDGTHIYLNSDSQIRYPVVFTDADSVREVSIRGEAFFKVAHNPEKPFRVHTEAGIIQVLGTQFNVHDYPDEAETILTLAEGSIAFNDETTDYTLRPNEQLIRHKENGRIDRRSVSASTYISWIDGIFEFNAMPLENIMKQLARWYDIDYRFDDPQLKTHQFTGITFRHASLESLLQLIEKTTAIHFTIQERTILITNY